MEEDILDSISAWDAGKAPEDTQKEEKMKKPKTLPKWPLPVIVWLAGTVPELVLHFYSAKGGTTLWNCGVYFPALMALEGDCGAKSILRAHEGDLLAVDCRGENELCDCDDPQALRALAGNMR